MRDLTGKAVLVTGAASGIGRATALAFAKEGADPLLLNDINEEGLALTAVEIEAMGRRAFVLPADVSDFAAVRDMVGAAIEQAGRIDVLANIAGVGTICPFELLELEDWKKTIDVNLWGCINTVFAVFPHMAAKKSGHIVNISSISGLWADMLYIAPYITSKFGVVGLSQALLAEGSLCGIRVSCVCPGVVRTPIYRTGEIRGFRPDIRDRTGDLLRIGEEPENTAKTIVSCVKKNRFLVVTTPLGRFGYFIRRHFSSLMPFFDRLWPRLIDRATARYRIPANPRSRETRR